MPTCEHYSKGLLVSLRKREGRELREDWEGREKISSQFLEFFLMFGLPKFVPSIFSQVINIWKSVFPKIFSILCSPFSPCKQMVKDL